MVIAHTLKPMYLWLQKWFCCPLVVDCKEPDSPSNGYGDYTATTEGSTVVYSCDPGFVLCGDENRICLSTGIWSGSVPDCISEWYDHQYCQQGNGGKFGHFAHGPILFGTSGGPIATLSMKIGILL